MAKFKTAFCDHADCGMEFNINDMEHINDDGEHIYVCDNCADCMEDQTGYWI
jgi:hypothetical protein